MTSGGARVRSGPPADRYALRRERDGKSWIDLPAAGRTGEAPEWPLPRQTARERLLWEREWRRPQAIMWGELGQELEVALYIRNLRDVEKGNAPGNLRTLLKQQMDGLGLTANGMASLRWSIVTGSKAAAPRRSSTSTAKDRLTQLEVLDGGA